MIDCMVNEFFNQQYVSLCGKIKVSVVNCQNNNKMQLETRTTFSFIGQQPNMKIRC